MTTDAQNRKIIRVLLMIVATLVVALFSAPLCLLAHLLIALYYCFEQIRPTRRPAET